MLEQYKTIFEGGQGEIVEKKSRFIATVRLVETEEEALAFIEEMKKRYWDATHNCFVYSVGANREFTRCSDDGEPSGTAGRPMLDVILGEDIYNVAVVVTRYFGGTLLGTGGLVRAYSKAVQEGLKESRIIEKKYGISLEVTTDYTGIGKIQYLAGENKLPILDSEYTDRGLKESRIIEKKYGISLEVTTDYTGIGKIQYLAGENKLPILDSEYTDRVVLHLLVPSAEVSRIEKAITEGTNGRAKMRKDKDLYFALLDGEIHLFDH